MRSRSSKQQCGGKMSSRCGSPVLKRPDSVSSLKLIFLALSGKSADYQKIVVTIDEMMTLLSGVGCSDNKKVYCIKTYDETEDEENC